MVVISAYANASGIMVFGNARPISPKVTLIDVTASTVDGSEVQGSVCRFNNTDNPVVFENGIFYCQIKVLSFSSAPLHRTHTWHAVIREDAFQVHDTDPNRFSFVGADA
ncbi:hypothetical protein B0H13DRAFT_2338083 [Mycena leptocephala]|nr:hypothetical protein B0H13DRAFT_2338083 [Mycena leptocephala]